MNKKMVIYNIKMTISQWFSLHFLELMQEQQGDWKKKKAYMLHLPTNIDKIYRLKNEVAAAKSI